MQSSSIGSVMRGSDDADSMIQRRQGKEIEDAEKILLLYLKKCS